MPIKIGDATTRALFRMIVESRAAARAANPARRVDYRDAARDLAMRLDLPVRDLQRIAKQRRTERWGGPS